MAITNYEPYCFKHEKVTSNFARVKSFLMRRNEWETYWELRIAKTRKIMHEDIKAFEKKEGYKEETLEDVAGLVKPLIVFCFNEQANAFIEDNKFAIMFLNEQDIDDGVVAHECLHVSMAHERFIHFKMNYGPGDTLEDEERLAYFLTACVRGTWAAIRDQKQGDKKAMSNKRKIKSSNTSQDTVEAILLNQEAI